MTEEEAKTKWCPWGRGAGMYSAEMAAQNGYFDSQLNFIATTTCIGSGCMAWRSDPGCVTDTEDTPKTGYCGLAGKP